MSGREIIYPPENVADLDDWSLDQKIMFVCPYLTDRNFQADPKH